MSQAGEMKSLHAVVFEALHKRFKYLYENSSHRKRTAMGEVVSMQNVETMETTDHFINSRLERKAMNGSEEEAQNVDSCILARSGAKRTRLAFESEMLEVEVGRNVQVVAHKERQTARNQFLTLDSDGYRVFVRLVQSYFTDCGEYLNVTRYKTICMPKYAYVYSCRAPTLRDEEGNGFIEFLDVVWKVVQRFVTAEYFYGSRQRCFDSILVTRERRVESKLSLGCPQTNSVSFAKAFPFVKVLSDDFGNNVCRIHGKIVLYKVRIRPK